MKEHNMKMKVIISTIIVLTIIFLFTLNSCSISIPSVTTSVETSDKETISKETAATASETNTKDNTSDQIKVTNPMTNQVVGSPLTVEGEARGTWFFEATFPVNLLDAIGDVIASSPANAQGEWMTQDFVSFKAQLIFEKPATNTGVLVLKKDNPSGLPENDASIEIPILFESKTETIIEETDPSKGEYFVNAVLKSIDVKNNMITVEQLINEPNQKEIFPEVELSKDCKIIKVILERPGEKETVTEITLDSIKLGSEIGIIFKSENTARAIIYQEIIEK
jgi:hypothetical protein